MGIGKKVIFEKFHPKSGFCGHWPTSRRPYTLRNDVSKLQNMLALDL